MRQIVSLRSKLLVILPSVAISLCSAGTIYSFGFIGHGYIGQQAQDVEVRINGDKATARIFVPGAISADVGHLDNDKMHNAAFGYLMLDNSICTNTDEASYAASWICHGESDVVWRDWLDDKGILPLDPGPETWFKFLFDAYAVINEDYEIPASLYTDKNLIDKAYYQQTQTYLSPTLVDFTLFGIVMLMVVEDNVISAAREVLDTCFDLSPPGDSFNLVKISFAPTIRYAKLASQLGIEKEWYDVEQVEAFKASLKNNTWCTEDYFDEDTNTERSNWSTLTDGWERYQHVVDPPAYVDYSFWGSEWSGFSEGWVDDRVDNPNVEVNLWARCAGYVSVNVKVSKRKKKPPRQEGVTKLVVSPALSNSIENKRAARRFAINDPLLMTAEADLGTIEDRQRSLLRYIGEAVTKAGKDVCDSNLAEIEEATLVYNERLANLIANAAVEGLEKLLLNYYVLETRRQAIASGGDVLQLMPGEIPPYGVEPGVPGGKPIITFVSDFDYLLAFDLVDLLTEHSYAPIRKSAEEWGSYKNERRIAVIGGLYPSQGMDTVIQELLTHASDEERAGLDEKGHLSTVLRDVFAPDQKIFLFVGQNSFDTRIAVVARTQLHGEVYDRHGGPLVGGIPYLIIGNVVVPEGKTLTIEAGTEAYFGSGFKIVANGTLFANGNSDKPIYLVSKDTPYRGVKLTAQLQLKNGGELKPGPQTRKEGKVQRAKKERVNQGN